MGRHQANRAYRRDLDVRDYRNLVDRVREPPPAGVLWLLLAPRRGRKTWTLQGLKASLAPTLATYVDLRAPNALSHVPAQDGACLLLDEPLALLQDEANAAQFVAWCANHHEAGTRVVLALTPWELELLFQADRATQWVDLKSLLSISPLSETEAKQQAKDDPEALRVLEEIGPDKIGPDEIGPDRRNWRRSPFLLELLFEINEKIRLDGRPLPLHELLRTAIQECERGSLAYFEHVFERGLSDEQRNVVLAVAGGAGDTRHATAETLAEAHLLERRDGRTYRLADPVLAWHLAPLRIHHLSDIHVGPKSAESIDAKEAGLLADAVDPGFVREGYLSYLRKARAEGRSPHLIIISGDIVEWATEAQYAEAKRWMDELPALLEPHILLERETPRILLVGGNHDVDWSQTRGGPIQARHKRFADAFTAFPHPHLEDPPERRKAAVVAYPDLGVEVLLLGSAEFGGEIDEDRERLVLQKEMAKLPKDPGKQDRGKAEDLATKAARIDPGLVHARDLDRLGEHRYRHPIRIAVLHHPISSLPSTEVTRFAGLLNAGAVKQALLGAGFSIVLHGHVHAGFLAEERWPGRHGGRTLHIAAAPSLGSREIAENNGFNEIEIRRTRDAAGKQSHDIVIRRFVREGERSWRPNGYEMGPFRALVDT